MGGPLVVRTAATIPNRIGAGGSFHGGGLVTDKPDSPHLLAPKIKARMYFGIWRRMTISAAAGCEGQTEGILWRGERSGGNRSVFNLPAWLVCTRYARRERPGDLQQARG